MKLEKKVKLVNGIIIGFFVLLFLIFIGLKLMYPKGIVGGDNNKIKYDYKIQTDDKIVASKSQYSAVINRGGECGKHAPLGFPTFNYGFEKKPLLLCYENYAVAYDGVRKIPLFETHVLRKKDLKAKKVERTNDFRPDEVLFKNKVYKKYMSLPQDYTNTGYDRGHLAPASDFAHNQKAMSESFYMTNIAPQAPNHNRGVWSLLEQDIRKYLLNNKKAAELYIITGVAFYKEKETKKKKTFGLADGSIGQFNAGQKIPTYFYKVVVEPKSGNRAAFIIRNTNEDGTIHYNNRRISIAKLEKITGLDFHSDLSADMKDTLERKDGTLLYSQAMLDALKRKQEEQKQKQSNQLN